MSSEWRILMAASASCLCFLAANAAATPPGTLPYRETQTLRLTNPGPLDDLGFSVAASGNLLVSGAVNVKNSQGADVGAAFVYRKSANGQWVVDGTLTPSDGEHNDAFGEAVDIDGHTVIVGVPSQGSKPEGAAYVFQRQGANDWQEVTKFSIPGGVRNEGFGENVSISGNVIAVSAVGHDDSPAPGLLMAKGAVYIYEQQPEWLLQTKLQPVGAQYGDFFGHSLDLSDDTLVATSISAYSGDNWRGAAYLFDRSGTAWTEVARLSLDGVEGAGAFGWNVDLDGDRLLATASTSERNGRVFVFEKNNFGIWERTAELIAHDLDPRWYFGDEIALSGNLAAVSASSPSAGIAGAVVYVFEIDDAGQWHQRATLSTDRALHSFAFSLALEGSDVFVGSGVNSPGAIHIFSQVPEPASFVQVVAVLVIAATTLLRSRRKAGDPA